VKARVAPLAAMLAWAALLRAPVVAADILPPEPPGMTPEQREKWVREQNEEKARWYADREARRAKETTKETWACSRSAMAGAGPGALVFVVFGAAMALTSRRRGRAPAC